VLADLGGLEVAGQELQHPKLGGRQRGPEPGVQGHVAQGLRGVPEQVVGQGFGQVGRHEFAGLTDQGAGQGAVAEQDRGTGLNEPAADGEPGRDADDLGGQGAGGAQRGGGRADIMAQGQDKRVRGDAVGSGGEAVEVAVTDQRAGPADQRGGAAGVAGQDGEQPLPGQCVGL